MRPSWLRSASGDSCQAKSRQAAVHHPPSSLCHTSFKHARWLASYSSLVTTELIEIIFHSLTTLSVPEGHVQHWVRLWVCFFMAVSMACGEDELIVDAVVLHPADPVRVTLNHLSRWGRDESLSTLRLGVGCFDGATLSGAPVCLTSQNLSTPSSPPLRSM